MRSHCNKTVYRKVDYVVGISIRSFMRFNYFFAPVNCSAALNPTSFIFVNVLPSL